MLEKMIDQQFLLSVLTGVGMIVLLQKIIVTLIYRRLKKQTDNLPNANGHWIRQMKQKFESTYRVSGNETNVALFVDRQVAKLRFFKIGVHGMETFYRKAQLICMLLGGSSYILAARAGKTIADCNTFLLMGAMAALVLQLLDNLSGNRRSAQMIRLNLQEYLEHMLLPKLDRGEAVDRYLNKEQPAKELETDTPWDVRNRRRMEMEETAAADIRMRKDRNLSGEEEQRIVQDVLKEFLT